MLMNNIATAPASACSPSALFQVALLDKLKRDLEKDVQENEHDETTAQKDYERFMSDTVAARTADSTSVSWG